MLRRTGECLREYPSITKPLGVLGCIGILLAAVATPAYADKYSVEVGDAVPVFTLKAIHGVSGDTSYVTLDKYFAKDSDSAKKAVLLSFFATYCEPCKREMPYLQALNQAYADKGLQVLLVSIDKDADKIEEAKALAQKAGVTFPVLSDRFNIVAKRYFISKLPCVYLINGEGKVDMVKVGYSGDMTKILLDDVRRAIGVPSSAPVPEAVRRFLDGHGGDAIEVVEVPVEESSDE